MSTHASSNSRAKPLFVGDDGVLCMSSLNLTAPPCHRPRRRRRRRRRDDETTMTTTRTARNFFLNDRSGRCDSFGPKIVKIRAILAIFRPFEVLGCQKSRIFERPFTPRGWLRSASNFGKTHFRRFPTFHFSTSKKKKSGIFLD